MRDLKGNSVDSAILNQINHSTGKNLLGSASKTQEAGWRGKQALAFLGNTAFLLQILDRIR